MSTSALAVTVNSAAAAADVRKGKRHNRKIHTGDVRLASIRKELLDLNLASAI
jgi:hypothetical protein